MERGKGERKTTGKGQDSGQGGSNTSLVGMGMGTGMGTGESSTCYFSFNMFHGVKCESRAGRT